MSDKSTDMIVKLTDVVNKARSVVEGLQKKAEQNDIISASERRAIEAVVNSSVGIMGDVRKRAKERRTQRIKELEDLIKMNKSALTISGLTVKMRNSIKSKLNSQQSELLRISNSAAMDFRGILSEREVKRIENMLENARKDVQSKQKAAAFLGTMLNIANTAHKFVGKISPAI